MKKNAAFWGLLVCVVLSAVCFGQEPPAVKEGWTRIATYEKEYSDARVVMGVVEGQRAAVVVFDGSDDLHYYADKETAPGGYFLNIKAEADGVEFGEAEFPAVHEFYDAGLEMNIDVYVGDFNVYFPIVSSQAGVDKVDVKVTISGIACTSKTCLMPFEYELAGGGVLSGSAEWAKFEKHKEAGAETEVEAEKEKAAAGEAGVVEGGLTTAMFYLLLAVVAGLSFNVMPCVLPVIPLVINRLMGQAKESRPRCLALGAGFCGGIILFFMAFAVISVIVQLVTGVVFSWSDQLRYPPFIIGMSLLLVVMALFMFDVFTIGIPSSVAGKSGSGHGMAGSVGMGFLAALLSTPCSGAIIAAVLVWAQTQSMQMSVLAFLLMGVGMAIPYALLIIFPSLLNKIPKPGDWMEIIRKVMGFLLLVIAVKLFGALPKSLLVHTLYYALVLSFAVWMWGSWVGFNTPRGKKWFVRGIAVLIAVAAGFWLLPEKKSLIDWKAYDAAVIQNATEQGRPVVIKFTADWCTNCVVVERRVYKDEAVADAIKSFDVLAVKADTTAKDYPATVDLVDEYGEAGNVPVTVYIDPAGTRYKLRGIFKKEELLDLLKESHL